MGYPEVIKSIEAAAAVVKRNPKSIRLLAVSKTKSAAEIRLIYAAGQRDFAENYSDELIKKAAELTDLKDLNWVYIGQLQSNKIQKLLSVCSEIQTVASEKHARYIERYVSEQHGKAFPVWIHVNVGDEEQKFGIDLNEVDQLSHFISEACPHLQLQGLMAIPPAIYQDASYPNEVPELYHKLRTTADKAGLGKLSLGMSSDLNMAIKAGSDCVRIGTAIFGARTVP